MKLGRAKTEGKRVMTLKNIIANIGTAWTFFGFKTFKYLIVIFFATIFIGLNFAVGCVVQKGLLLVWVLAIVVSILLFFATARRVLREKNTTAAALPIDIASITLDYEQGVSFGELLEYAKGMLENEVAKKVFFEAYGHEFVVDKDTDWGLIAEEGRNAFYAKTDIPRER